MWRVHKYLRLLSCWLVCAITSGCASLPAPPADSLRQDWGKQVIAPARYAPQSNFRPFAVGHKQGMAKGAAGGTTLGLTMAGIYSAGGALEAIVAPYLAVIAVPVFATSRAMAGKHAAITEQNAATFEQLIQQNLAELKLPTTLAKVIAGTAQADTAHRLPVTDFGPAAPDSSPDYRTQVRHDIGSVLEVRVPEVGFAGDKQLYFYLVADIRVIRTRDGARLYQREFIYQSDVYPAPLWSENQAALFQAELQRSYQSLAESVVEQIYLLTALPLESRAKPESVTGTQFPGSRDACGLAWVSPPRDFYFSLKLGEMKHPNMNRFPRLTTQQPRLAWEAFPRESDRTAANAALLANISHVRYDLRVWQVEAKAPPKLIYERRDLTTPFHILEQPLASGKQYFWSARARFDLNGQLRGTKWGYFRTPYYAIHGADKVKAHMSPGTIIGVFMAGVAPRDPCTLDFIPRTNYYRFEIQK
jgi:hypothetical protein